MQLTRCTDYALRVLIYLVLRKDTNATITEIAAFYRISRNHLVKIVHVLGVKGFIQTTRGKGGGIRLARAPEEISLGAVVRSMEPHFDIVECFNGENAHCAVLPVCGLRGALYKATQEFLSVLDGYSLANLVAEKPSLLMVRR